MKKSATSSVQASGLFHRMFSVGARAANALPISILTLAALLLALTLLIRRGPARQRPGRHRRDGS